MTLIYRMNFNLLADYVSAKFVFGRAVLSDCRQPFDEPLLPDVAARGCPEVGEGSLRPCPVSRRAPANRLEGCRPVTAGRVPALNFILDLLPGAFAAAPDRFEPGLANFLGGFHEEGIDYPNGETCPDCPYWADGTAGPARA
jgi:hypothetical protein